MSRAMQTTMIMRNQERLLKLDDGVVVSHIGASTEVQPQEQQRHSSNRRRGDNPWRWHSLVENTISVLDDPPGTLLCVS